MPRRNKPLPTPEEARKAWIRILPDEQQRKKVARIMADTIQIAHAIAPGTWMISYRPGPSVFSVNVGRIFTVSVKPGHLSIAIDTDVLPEDSIPAEWGGTDQGKCFPVVPEVTWRTAAIDVLLAEWDHIEPAFVAAVKKGAKTASTSPWYQFHFDAAVDIISEETGHDLPRPVHPSRIRASAEDLRKLAQEFVNSYPASGDGLDHRLRYIESRSYFRETFAAIKANRDAGTDVTEDVLAKLLPHANTSHTRTLDVWRTTAPVITRDLKQWFVGAGWTTGNDWPQIASLILEFFETCEADPANLEAACKKFSSEVPSKGFQAGILSPGLMALNPDRFALINIKPLYVLKHFGDVNLSSDLADYPEANRIMLELAELAAEPLFDADGFDGMNVVERFDMFSHWLYAVRKWRPGGVRYWKIAPGERGWKWADCHEKGIIAMGWDKFGDVGSMSRAEFDELAERLEEEEEDLYKKSATSQVWTFAHEIQPGDRVVANKGVNQVLGVGTVDGDYRFVHGEDYGHHLPIKWELTQPFAVNKPGWRRTIVSLSEKQFRKIFESSSGVADGPEQVYGTSPNVWLFQANPKIFNLEQEIKVKGNETLTRWRTTRYRREIKAGDMVLLWQAGKRAGLYGIAEVTGLPTKATQEDIAADPYIFERDWFTPIRITLVLDKPILKKDFLEHPLLTETQVLNSPQGTNFKVTAEEWKALQELLDEEDGSLEVNPEVQLEHISDQTGFEMEELERWIDAIKRKKQAVLYGPPGTGKTYIAEWLANHLVGGGDGFVQLIQFHPAYTYEDFIQGLRPEASDNGGLDYRLVPGRFLEFCDKAAKCKGPCVLILDEINRANLARVFGELMYLLEYRQKSVPLAGGRELKVPENVRIIGTMNTADRSIALVDHALRRRFAFISLRPQYGVLERFHAETDFDAESLVRVLKRLNQAIDDPNYAVGISFFMSDDLATHLPDIWRMEIEPYLEEYFFDQAAKVKEFSWAKLEGEIG